MRKGEKMSEELRKRLSKIHKKNFSNGRIVWNKNKKLDSEQKSKLNLSGLKKGHGWNKGISAHWIIGDKNPRWVSDKSKLQKYSDTNKQRISSIYRNWRNNVYKRDSWNCCINNNDCKGRIEAHHILSFTKFPELRYDINNGITLCKFHHPRKRDEEEKLIKTFRKLIDNYKLNG